MSEELLTQIYVYVMFTHILYIRFTQILIFEQVIFFWKITIYKY